MPEKGKKIMKKFVLLFVFALLFVITGCASRRLNIGVYRNVDSSRDDMAMVCDDYIILQVKSPKNSEGALAYWTWGGKYTYNDDGSIDFDMDRETYKRWKFYFEFSGRRDGITISDLTSSKNIFLRYSIPKRRNNDFAPVPVGTTGVDPHYQYIEKP